MRTYTQLSLDERYQIQAMVRQRYSQAAIARELGRSASTISREVRRNRYSIDFEPYKATYAQRLTRERRIDKGIGQRRIQGDLRILVEEKLRLGWSPEQISGRVRKERTHPTICAETIYQHILRDTKNLGFYRYCLRTGGYGTKRFSKSKRAQRTRERKNWIKDRPAAANRRSELGHWERDMLLGKRGGAALLTLIDRKSRFLRVARVASLEADVVAAATQAALAGLPCKTITNDNGVEFQRDELLQQKMKIPIYFCDPQSPWQRGSIENANGLIRQYVPKGSDIAGYKPVLGNAVEEALNFRPRRSLGYRTPHEVFYGKKLVLTKDGSMHFGIEISRAI